jgi:hypothetical protein
MSGVSRVAPSRVDQLISHHERRLVELLQAVRSHPGSVPWDLAGYLTWSRPWEQYDGHMRIFAVSETTAHLWHLVARGQIDATPTSLPTQHSPDQVRPPAVSGEAVDAKLCSIEPVINVARGVFYSVNEELVPTGLPRRAHFGASCSMMAASRRPSEVRVAGGATHPLDAVKRRDWAAADLAGGCAAPYGRLAPRCPVRRSHEDGAAGCRDSDPRTPRGPRMMSAGTGRDVVGPSWLCAVGAIFGGEVSRLARSSADLSRAPTPSSIDTSTPRSSPAYVAVSGWRLDVWPRVRV